MSSQDLERQAWEAIDIVNAMNRQKAPQAALSLDEGHADAKLFAADSRALEWQAYEEIKDQALLSQWKHCEAVDARNLRRWEHNRLLIRAVDRFLAGLQVDRGTRERCFKPPRRYLYYLYNGVLQRLREPGFRLITSMRYAAQHLPAARLQVDWGKNSDSSSSSAQLFDIVAEAEKHASKVERNRIWTSPKEFHDAKVKALGPAHSYDPRDAAKCEKRVKLQAAQKRGEAVPAALQENYECNCMYEWDGKAKTCGGTKQVELEWRRDSKHHCLAPAVVIKRAKDPINQ